MTTGNTLTPAAPAYRILVADDETAQRAMVREILAAPQFHITEAQDGVEAWDALREFPFDAVLLDISMPGMNGDKVCRLVRDQLPGTRLPVIMVSGSGTRSELSNCLADGATDFIRKPYFPEELTARVEAAVSQKRLIDQLDNAESVLFTLARIVEAKDGNTGDHCARLSRNAMLFGEALGLSRDELLALRRGGVLHDIGKLGVPDSVLLKPGPLDNDEWDIMRQHTVIGADLIKGLHSMRLTMPIVRSHHERWDGAGYPDGLKGEATPLLARVFQIADIFDALLHARPYKPPMSLDEVLLQLRQEAGDGRCDPYLMAVFLDTVQDKPEAFAAPADADLGAAMFDQLRCRNSLARYQ